MAKRRDYGAERARAYDRAERLGYSRSWALGHPHRDELSKRQVNEIMKAPSANIIESKAPDAPHLVTWYGPDGKYHKLPITEAQRQHLPEDITELFPPAPVTPAKRKGADEPPEEAEEEPEDEDEYGWVRLTRDDE